MACRFPGAANVDEYWTNLRDGVESITFLTAEDLAASGVDPAVLDDPDYVPARGVLEDADRFDARFFGLSPREAALKDPQQRVFLECAWTAIENAGYDPDRFGGMIGVYAGVGLSTYMLNNLQANAGLVGSVPDTQTAIGNDKDHLPTYVSYKLNLTGPSVCVQTACSTSLVAAHLACQALLNGECDMALAGGVSIAVPLAAGYTFHEGGILSPDGRCRAFDARAGGTVGGNGAGVVVLKRLDDALADGDFVRAIIRGSAINNDGSLKVGYTAPSVEGQASVIEMALAVAEAEPDSIGYIEAHGTGTPLGDPIEIAALTRAFRRRTQRTGFCAIGSAKTNFGHLDAAAGAAGLIKAVLALEHRELPPSLHYQEPNPQIDFDTSPFFVNDALRAWETDGGPRRAGVSSFGVGGTNAHVVLEEAAQITRNDEPAPSRAWRLIPLSAKTGTALDTAAGNLAEHLKNVGAGEFDNVAYTLGVGRGQLAHRRAVVTQTAQDAALIIGESKHERVATGKVVEQPSVTFMFPGQGAQYVLMGQDLYAGEPEFRQHFDRCSTALEPHLGDRLTDLLYPPDADEAASLRLQQTSLAQPALFSIEYALAQLLMSWGIKPRAMIGHSIGEYVAACLAGVFDLDDALSLVASRGKLMQSADPGVMLAVPLAAEDAQDRLGEGLELATINDPSTCVVSGTEEAAREFEERLKDEGLAARRLHTSHAFHSKLMEPVLEPFQRAFEGIALQPPRIPYVSNLTGTWITDDQSTSPEYWAQHLRHTVLFEAGLRTLFESSPGALVEVGPGTTLTRGTRRHPERPATSPVVSTMRHPREENDDVAVLLLAVGTLWTSGTSVDWNSLFPEESHRVPLPTYPFERERFWIEPGHSSIDDTTEQGEIRKNKDISRWFYEPSWRRAGATASGTQAVVGTRNQTTESDRWLVFVDNTGLGTSLVGRLRALNAHVATVSCGDGFAREDSVTFQIDPTEQGDYDALFEFLDTFGQQVDTAGPVRVVHLWGLDVDGAPPDEQASDPASAGVAAVGAAELAVFSLFRIARAAANAEAATRLRAPTNAPAGGGVRLVVVSSGTMDVLGEEPLHAARAAALGACKVIPQELRNISCSAIDVASPASGAWRSETVARVLAEVAAPSSAPAVALRGKHRWLPTYEPVSLGEAEGLGRMRRAGVYAVLGGLGGVGFESAEFLAQSAEAKLALVGRASVPPQSEWDEWLARHPNDDLTSQRIYQIQSLEKLGAEVLTLQADVTDVAELNQALRSTEEHFGALHGVVFAVGAEKTAHPILGSDASDWAAQLAPKSAGLPALRTVLQGRDLDFCLLQSSLSAVLGAVGFAAYAAAHTYMDAFARECNRTGSFPWIAVDWDNWLNWKEPEAATGSIRAELVIEREEGAEALRRILGSSLTEIVVSTASLPARIERWINTDADQPDTDDEPDSAAKQPKNLHDRPGIDTEYVAPSTPVEQTMAGIWEESLGIAGVGTDDNFFELGGDSVLGILIVAKAKKAGLHLTPNHLFEHQTIAELARVCGTGEEIVADQAMVSGPVRLSPIQAWFFDRELVEPAHFNWPMLLEPSERLDPAIVQAAMGHMIGHHDALRLRFATGATGVEQTHAEEDDPPEVVRIDLSEVENSEREAAMEAELAGLQASLNLANGPVMRVALVETGADSPQRLFWVAHHLIVDALSWPVLLEDLEAAYRQLAEGSEVQLPAKTASFKQWCAGLQDEAARSSTRRDELDHWRDLGAASPPALPVDVADGTNTMGSVREIISCLSVEETERLLHEVPKTYNTRTDDLLLTALATVMARWTGDPRLLLDLEGHARDQGSGAIDVSRTVGWFTTIFPVLLSTRPEDSPGDAVKSIKEQLRQVPDRGAGFGILRYVNDDETVTAAMRAVPRPEVSFLYLGQAPGDGGSGLFTALDDPCGPSCGPDELRTHLLDVLVKIQAGRLLVTWAYSENMHRHETIAPLADDLMTTLRGLIDHCTASTAPGYTPSDFPDVDMSQEELDRFLDTINPAGRPSS